MKITLEVGEEPVKGKLPLTVQIEQVTEEVSQDEGPSHPEAVAETSVRATGKRWAELILLKNRLKDLDLATWLFLLAIAVYLGTRLVGLNQFPIYFFTDEAIQTQSIINLINNGYRDTRGVLFPTYFRNGEYYNLGLSVYLQWLPYVLFGKSAILTRAVSVFVTLIAAVSVGVILRDVFKMRYWWTGTLFLSITPAWFLHSRTAFETAEFTAFYAGTLCAYLLYLSKSPRFLYLTVFLGALAFYSYSPGQLLVPLTALGLLISDWRHHWENRRTALAALGLLLLLAIPYLRAGFIDPDAPIAHLHTLYSYWFEKTPLSMKLARYLSEFGIGLSPWYWYIPNDRDLPRHLMKDYGNILLITLPPALFGLAYIVRNLRLPACRAVLIALLISPAAAALVQTSITRVLTFVVPAAILTALGLEQYLRWLEDPGKRLIELGEGPGPNSKRNLQALIILLVGVPVAFISNEPINRIAMMGFAILLALQVSGVFERLAQSITRARTDRGRKFLNLPPSVIALLVFVVLAGTNTVMLWDALRNGPLWFKDYGLGGMQYGAFQVFDHIEQYVEEDPHTKIIFSPDWANGTDVVARFFLKDPSRIQIGSIRGHLTQKLPLDENTLFIITPQEFNLAAESTKFNDIQVEKIIPYPDGNPGFYFIRLRYTDHIDEIFAEEKAARQGFQESAVVIDGQEVKLRFSYLDSETQSESIALVFDNDPYSLAKTYENNPFIVEMTFPAPRTFGGFSIIIGSANVRVTLKCFSEPDAQPAVYTFEGQGTEKQPELSFDIPEPVLLEVLQVEVLDLRATEPAKVHIWELKLR